MIAKIIKNLHHSGVSVGDTGKVVEHMGKGVAIRFEKTIYTTTFGGATKTRPATIYFALDEVELINEPPDNEPKTSK